MKKRIRQYIGLLSAVLAYYAVHEGAHLIYALSTGVFRQIIFMGIGMQIGIYEERMSETGLDIFCSVGVAATMITAYVLTLTSVQICKVKSKTFKACLYYITIAMLLIDPLYLSIEDARLCRKMCVPFLSPGFCRTPAIRQIFATMFAIPWVDNGEKRMRFCQEQAGTAGIRPFRFQVIIYGIPYNSRKRKF